MRRDSTRQHRCQSCGILARWTPAHVRPHRRSTGWSSSCTARCSSTCWRSRAASTICGGEAPSGQSVMGDGGGGPHRQRRNAGNQPRPVAPARTIRDLVAVYSCRGRRAPRAGRFRRCPPDSRAQGRRGSTEEPLTENFPADVCYDQSGWPTEQAFSVQCTSVGSVMSRIAGGPPRHAGPQHAQAHTQRSRRRNGRRHRRGTRSAVIQKSLGFGRLADRRKQRCLSEPLRKCRLDERQVQSVRLTAGPPITARVLF
jgi:hypothetical protein